MALQELVDRFRSAAIRKGSEGGPDDHALLDSLSSAYHELVALGSPGENAFRALLGDESPEVRSWAAAQLLGLGDSTVVEVLEQIVALPGLLGFNAEQVLNEHRAGRLGPPFGVPAA